MSCGAIGSLNKLAVQGGASPRTFNGSSERYAFIKENLTPIPSYSGPERGVGDISQSKGHRRATLILYEGTIILECNKHNLNKWLPRTMWSSAVSSPYTIGTNSSNHEFDVLISKETGTFRYENCLVNELAIYGSEDRDDPFLYLAINIVAQSFSEATAWPNPEPSIGTSASHYPYTFYDSSVMLGYTFEVPNGRLVFAIRNKLVPVARQSITAQKFRTQGRDVVLSGQSLLTSDMEQIFQGSPTASIDTMLTISNATSGSVDIDMKNLQNVGMNHPTTDGPSFIQLPFEFKAGKSSIGAPELNATIS